MVNIVRPPQLPTKHPKLTIVIWIALALLAIPLASSLDKVMVSEEKGFLPPNAESMLAQKALEENGAGGEPDAIILVTNVPVNPDSFKELQSIWSQLNWRGVEKTSWVDILEGIRERVENHTREALNTTLTALEGYEMLWKALVNTTDQLRQLEQLINATQDMLAAADQAYSMFLNASQQASQSAQQLRSQLAEAARACRELPPQLGGLAVTVTAAEVLLETRSTAYEAGYLDPQELYALAQALSQQTGMTPREAAYILSLVFNTTRAAGGPSSFSTQLAFKVAADIMAQGLGDEKTRQIVLEAARLAGEASVEQATDLRSLMAEGRVSEAQSTAEELARQGVVGALQELFTQVTEEGGDAASIAERAFVEMVSGGCSEDSVTNAVRKALEEALSSTGLPPSVASYLASQLAVDAGVENTVLARQALGIVAARADEEGAPPTLIALINSTEASRILVEMDPEGRLVLASDPEAARRAATSLLLLSSETLGVDPEVVELVSRMGAEEAAFQLVSGNVPEEARGFLEALREEGLPLGEEGFLATARQVLLREMTARGVSEKDALLFIDSAERVLRGETVFESEVERVTGILFNSVAAEVLEELRGTLVSVRSDAFLVIVRGAGYDDVKQLTEELRVALKTRWQDSSAEATGGVVIQEEMSRAAVEDVKRSDVYSMVFVLIVLAIVLQGVVAILLPFTGIGLGLSLALGLAYVLASGGALTVTTIARTVMFSTGLGLGIDYATLVARRFREELAGSGDPRRASEKALRASLRPILAGAFTASVGFGSLALAWDFPFLRSIGTTVPLAIAMVTLSSLIFIPALLTLVGGRGLLWWPSKPRKTSGERGLSARVGSLVSRNAPLLLALVAVALVPAVMVHLGFEGSHDLTIMLPEGTPALAALKTITSEFDPGVIYPVYVVASSVQDAEQIASKLSMLDCVSEARVENITLPGGRAVVTVVLGLDPLSSMGVKCTGEIRRIAHGLDPGSLVGGAPAVSLDLEEMLNDRFYGRVLPVAVVLMFLSMLLAYGGVAVALSAVLGVVAAAEIAIALTVYYYGEVLAMPVPWFLPITVFTAILGVGMDYNSFSINRLAEASLLKREGEPRQAVAEGVGRAVGLVLGLALIMASAYGGLVLSSIPNLRMMGTALALGVLLAGVFAAMLLTPGLVAVMGRRAWWPWGPKSET